jgi:hypothetical protein
VNFRGRQSRGWDGLGSEWLRRLLGRLDAAAYTAALEWWLAALGEDVAGLGSAGRGEEKSTDAA